MDFSCFLSGMIRICTEPVLLFFWWKKKRARLFPALAALIVCFPVFMIANGIRNGFAHDEFYAAYLKQGLLYGIFEEGAKFLMLRFALESYDSRRDAVTYGLGHGYLESFFAGLSCFGLIGSGNAAPDILLVNLWSAIEGAASVTALTMIIFYGIRTGRSKITLPAAMLIHAFCNAFMGIFRFSTPIVIGVMTPVCAAVCYAAYRCWKALEDPYGDEYEY